VGTGEEKEATVQSMLAADVSKFGALIQGTVADYLREAIQDQGGIPLPEATARDKMLRGLRLIDLGLTFSTKGEQLKQEGLRLIGGALAGADLPDFWEIIKGACGVLPEEEKDPEAEADKPREETKTPASRGPSPCPGEKRDMLAAALEESAIPVKAPKPSAGAAVVYPTSNDAGIGIGRKAFHRDAVGPTRASWYTCQLCIEMGVPEPYNKRNKDQVAGHIRATHLNQVLGCHLCEHTGLTQKNLREHHAAKHRGYKRFSTELKLDLDTQEGLELLQQAGLEVTHVVDASGKPVAPIRAADLPAAVGSPPDPLQAASPEVGTAPVEDTATTATSPPTAQEAKDPEQTPTLDPSLFE